MHTSVGAGLALLLSACSLSPPKYFAEAKISEGIEASVGLSAFSQPIPSSNPKTLLDLGPEAQAAIVERSAATGAGLAAEFATPIKAAPSLALKVDKSRIALSRRLHFTLFTENFQPWERLTEAKISVSPPHGWVFTGWTAAAVERTSISLANVVDTAVKSGGVSAVPFLWGWIPAGGGVNASVQNTQQTTRNLAVEVVKFLPSIADHRFDLRLYAPFPQTNVAGAYTVDVKLARAREFFAYVNELKMIGGEPQLDVTHVYFPAITAADESDKEPAVEATAIRRWVTNRDAQLSISESDDEVIFAYEDVRPVGTLNYEGPKEPLGLWFVDYADRNRANGEPIFVNVRSYNSASRGQSDQCALFVNAEQAIAFASLLEASGFFSGNPRFDYESSDKKYRFTATVSGGRKTAATFAIRPVDFERITPRDGGGRFAPANLLDCYVDESR